MTHLDSLIKELEKDMEEDAPWQEEECNCLDVSIKEIVNDMGDNHLGKRKRLMMLQSYKRKSRS